MKKEKLFSISTLVGILTISISYFSVMEYIIRKYIINLDHDYQRSKLFKKRENPNTIWGDSQTMTAIKDLGDFKNFSTGYENYEQIELKLKEYYSKKDIEGKVILQLALHGFSEFRNKFESKTNSQIYFNKQNKFNLYIANTYFRNRSYDYLKNFVKNKFTIKIKENEKYNSDGSVTYLDTYIPFDKSKPKKRKIDPNQFIPNGDLKNSKNYHALIRIINFLKNENFDICFISTPWNKDLFKYMIDEKNFEKVNKFYNKISIDNSIKYRNYTNYYLPDNLFSDMTHLNNKGSAKFTKMIEKDCF